MILKGSQRAGGMQLARHLLNLDDNDHVTIHEVRGFVSDDLAEAFKEAYAISRGTRCKQFLFSLSLSPPETESVPVDVFEGAIAAIEEKMGLANQPRAIVFHEKEGRRHAHCVWSRINIDSMTAINLPHFKLKLRDISRQLYLENDWRMPNGLANSEERNPLNFSREEWQQAKRVGIDPRKIKEVFQDCWAMSDGLKAFQHALEARGYYLAQGDRRGFVAVDWRGEVFSVSRYVGVRAKEVRERLGDPSQLPRVADINKQLAKLVEEKLVGFKTELQGAFDQGRLGLKAKRDVLVKRQREERQLLIQKQKRRQASELQARAERFRKGLAGVWDWFTGRRSEIRKANEEDLAKCEACDAAEKQTLIDRHMTERQELQQQFKALRSRHERELEMLGIAQPKQTKETRLSEEEEIRVHSKRFDLRH